MRSWHLPVTQHVWDMIAFFRHSERYRPPDSLFYRVLFEAFGMQALPYRLARRLAVLREVAVITIVLCAYHPGFASYNFNTGYCYDLLCFFFHIAALLHYLNHRHPTWGQVLSQALHDPSWLSPLSGPARFRFASP